MPEVGDWFRSLTEHPWLLWAAAALALALLEVVSLDLVLVMLAAGAAGGAVAALAGAGAVGQVLTAVVVAAVMTAGVRPLLLRRLRVPPAATTGPAALVGRSAHVLAEVGPRGGLVKLAGETWSARSAQGVSFAVGEDVVVLAIDGATAVVGAGPGVVPPGPGAAGNP
ncbi:NfeD family protein [Kineococcus glutinatus]|uniref:NfeD-like C-terminal domain-containing protein n=1 Tax=Kineococcus glutinatus TaxID=1070872 RepID=A0ABP9HZ49_9ACTN